jgi:hypothetical protein
MRAPNRTADTQNNPRSPVIWEDPCGTNFSQRTIRNNNYAEQMKNGQWDWNRPDAPLDRVIFEDGTKVSLDNRRLDAALEAGETRIPFVNHQASDLLPEEYQNDVYWGPKHVRTWGDMLGIRTRNNRLPPEGTQNRPRKR